MACRQVICKVMAREKCAKSWHLVDREIDALRMLDHPHVLRLNEVFKDTIDVLYRFCL